MCVGLPPATIRVPDVRRGLHSASPPRLSMPLPPARHHDGPLGDLHLNQTPAPLKRALGARGRSLSLLVVVVVLLPLRSSSRNAVGKSVKV